MITGILFLAEAFATNRNFMPDFLYIGTVILDLAIIMGFFL